jgi:hypothetical protein
MQASLFERHVASGLTPIASPYIREDAGTQRYNVGTDTPKLWATTVILPVRSCGAEIRGTSTSSAKGLLPRSRQIALIVPSGNRVPYTIFRAPIPACWFSETIEMERPYFPLNHAVSV